MTTLQKAIEQEQARKNYRKTYNTDPKNKEKRTLYNKKRNGGMSIASKVMSGKLTEEDANKQLELLEREYNDGIAALKGEKNIARRPQHTNNA